MDSNSIPSSKIFSSVEQIFLDVDPTGLLLDIIKTYINIKPNNPLPFKQDIFRLQGTGNNGRTTLFKLLEHVFPLKVYRCSKYADLPKLINKRETRIYILTNPEPRDIISMRKFSYFAGKIGAALFIEEDIGEDIKKHKFTFEPDETIQIMCPNQYYPKNIIFTQSDYDNIRKFICPDDLQSFHKSEEPTFDFYSNAHIQHPFNPNRNKTADFQSSKRKRYDRYFQNVRYDRRDQSEDFTSPEPYWINETSHTMQSSFIQPQPIQTSIRFTFVDSSQCDMCTRKNLTVPPKI